MEDDLEKSANQLSLDEDHVDCETTEDKEYVESDGSIDIDDSETGKPDKDESEEEDLEEVLHRERKQKEDKLSEAEKTELRDQAQSLKNNGNEKFKQQCYTDSVQDYTEALAMCPLCFLKERSIMYSNRAAAYVYLDNSELVIKDCTDSLALHPHYPKPLLRRAQAYEKTEKLDEALEDYKRLLGLDQRSIEALAACKRLPKQIEERNEKLKTEMMDKLKDLGNLVLRPFGLSTDNFNLQQNASGGYSVNFSNS